ncbi:glycosyltransferase family 2 protein [Magnetofaba australis]|uniref:Putative glycosyl transferase group 2 family protein n=1 Tax=Magnetofaba australis IT-1 TaxID=1434232 RepID=A0A1Y2K272_9PROT|nr:glycosyltransferase family 2 protein [Magnetofaba australis]OSM02130.1 putative glycosyl transferase group 2 family protein [Magnetofaba australis IT-1]
MVPITAVIAIKNEANNLERCLSALDGWITEAVVADSQSTDGSQEIAQAHGATLLQFHYQGGWPKKRQWVLDTYAIQTPWVLLLDADERVTEAVKREIETAITQQEYAGFRIKLDNIFMGVTLTHGDFSPYKTCLFRTGQGRFEQRLQEQTTHMADMEVHEHVKLDGPSRALKHGLEHRNVNTLSRYILKHNEYSNWEAPLMRQLKHGALEHDELPPRLFGGTQAQRRRWLKHKLFFMPGFSLLMFVYHYLLRGGCLHGAAGFYYAAFQAIQRFHIKAKVRELELIAQYGSANPPPEELKRR